VLHQLFISIKAQQLMSTTAAGTDTTTAAMSQPTTGTLITREIK